jgi:hypothetical protein
MDYLQLIRTVSLRKSEILLAAAFVSFSVFVAMGTIGSRSRLVKRLLKVP